eukprot:1422707-Rhodomonas_salina.1
MVSCALGRILVVEVQEAVHTVSSIDRTHRIMKSQAEQTRAERKGVASLREKDAVGRAPGSIFRFQVPVPVSQIVAQTTRRFAARIIVLALVAKGRIANRWVVRTAGV